jgi:integrase
MARKAGQLISRGPQTWLVRVSLGRDPETGTRKYHDRTVHGSFREAQTYLIARLQERDIGRLPRAAAIRFDHYLDQWLATSAKPRLRPKNYTDYETLLRLHIRPCLRQAARGNYSVRHSERLCSDVQPWAIATNNRVYECRAAVRIPPSSALENAGRRSLLSELICHG